MGHGHSSSHKRLKSISTSRNCEFTEVVDFEFSDAGTFSEPIKPVESKTRAVENSIATTTIKNVNTEPTINKNIDSSLRTRQQTEEVQTVPTEQNQYPKDLLVIIEHLKDVEKNITNMSHEDFFVYFPTFKDDLHNCWQKVYGITEINLHTKQKKVEVIDNIRVLLRKINARL